MFLIDIATWGAAVERISTVRARSPKMKGGPAPQPLKQVLAVVFWKCSTDRKASIHAVEFYKRVGEE